MSTPAKDRAAQQQLRATNLAIAKACIQSLHAAVWVQPMVVDLAAGQPDEWHDEAISTSPANP